MLYVEDILTHIYETHKIEDSWWSKFIESTAFRVYDGNSLTTSQAEFVLKYIRLFQKELEKKFNKTDLDILSSYPKYKFGLKQSIPVEKEIRVLCGNVLGFRSKAIPELIEKLKSLQNNSNRVFFSKEHLMWVVHVYPNNISNISDIIGDFGFNYDSGVAAMLENIIEPFKNQSIEISDEFLRINTVNGLVQQYIENILNEDGYGGVLSATPRNARALLRIAAITKIDVDPKIAELSEYSDDVETFIKDMDYRCGISSLVPLETVIHAASLTGEKPIFLLDYKNQPKHVYEEKAAIHGVEMDFVLTDDAANIEYIKKNRHRPLICLWNFVKNTETTSSSLLLKKQRNISGIDIVLKEFSNTIIYFDKAELQFRKNNDLWRISSCLFPHHFKIAPFLENDSKYKTKVANFGFDISKPADIAFLFGIHVPVAFSTLEN